MQDARDLIEHLYAAFNRRDFDTVLSALHPAIEWPGGWDGARIRGHAQLREFWTRQMESIDPVSIPETIDRLPDGRIAVAVRQTVRTRQGVLVSQCLIGHVYTLEDGLLRAMDIVVDS